METSIMDNVSNSGFDVDPSLLQPCPRCGYSLTKVPTEIPHHNIPSTLVRSKYVPSPPDRSVIQELISSSDISIRTLQAKISNLQASLSFLQSRLSNVQIFNKFQHSLLSPIRKLPDELLTEIFQSYVCDKSIDVVEPYNPAQWDLQKVCARWRNIVRGTPVLWNSFRWRWKERTDEDIISLRVRHCLEFSGTLPLSIGLSPGLNSAEFHKMMEVIAGHADRWADFSVGGHKFDQSASKLRPATRLIKQRGLPRLRKLSIFWGERSSFVDIFKNATALEEVKLYNSYVPHPFPWTKVKRFTISDCSTSSLPDALSSALIAMSKSLEELTWSEGFRDTDISEVVTLPSLHTFNISRAWARNSTRTLQWSVLRVPSLTCIGLMGDAPNGNSPFPLLLPMIQASACVIKRLRVKSCDSPTLDIFKEFSSIEELSLIGVRYVDVMVISKLIWDSTNDINDPRRNFLPSLRKLELVTYPGESDTDKFLIMEKFMRSRSPAASESMMETQMSFAVPLLLVRYGNELSMDCTFSNRLKKLGDELGIKVEYMR